MGGRAAGGLEEQFDMADAAIGDLLCQAGTKNIRKGALRVAKPVLESSQELLERTRCAQENHQSPRQEAGLGKGGSCCQAGGSHSQGRSPCRESGRPSQRSQAKGACGCGKTGSAASAISRQGRGQASGDDESADHPASRAIGAGHGLKSGVPIRRRHKSAGAHGAVGSDWRGDRDLSGTGGDGLAFPGTYRQHQYVRQCGGALRQGAALNQGCLIFAFDKSLTLDRLALARWRK